MTHPPTDLLTALLADLDAESRSVRDLVAGLPDWSLATPAPGWDVAAQVAHLAWTDEAATAAAGSYDVSTPEWDALVAAAVADPVGVVDAEAKRAATAPREALLRRWDRGRPALHTALAAVPAGAKMPWFGPPMSAASMATARLMETWAHGLDLAAAAGVHPVPSPRIRHVAHLGVRTRDYAFLARGLTPPAEPFRVELTGPDGELWQWGPLDAAQRLTGSAWDFCRLCVQRVHREDTDLVAAGADAETWLGVAQCFAGAPGEGRPSRG